MRIIKDLKESRRQSRLEAIDRKISKLSLKRRALKRKALKLTHERERMLGQELTATPRGLQGQGS